MVNKSRALPPKGLGLTSDTSFRTWSRLRGVGTGSWIQFIFHLSTKQTEKINDHNLSHI